MTDERDTLIAELSGESRHLANELLEILLTYRMQHGPDAFHCATTIAAVQFLAGMATEMELGAMHHVEGMEMPSDEAIEKALLHNHAAGREVGRQRANFAGEVVSQVRKAKAQ